MLTLTHTHTHTHAQTNIHIHIQNTHARLEGLHTGCSLRELQKEEAHGRITLSPVSTSTTV